MDGIKTDLFPENLRASKNDMGKQETGVRPKDHTESMKTQDGYAETMMPEEPLPESR